MLGGGTAVASRAGGVQACRLWAGHVGRRMHSAGRRAAAQHVRRAAGRSKLARSAWHRLSLAQGKIRVKQLDLADLASVKAMGAELAASLPRLDLLILNAGVMACPKVGVVGGHRAYEPQGAASASRPALTLYPSASYLCRRAPPNRALKRRYVGHASTERQVFFWGGGEGGGLRQPLQLGSARRSVQRHAGPSWLALLQGTSTGCRRACAHKASEVAWQLHMPAPCVPALSPLCRLAPTTLATSTSPSCCYPK